MFGNYILVGGKKYRVNFSWGRVLMAEEYLEKGDKRRAVAVLLRPFSRIRCVVGNHYADVLEGIFGQLSHSSGGKRLISFKEDFPLIYSAFLQSYGVRLKKSMDFREVVALLQGISTETRLYQVLKERETNLSRW